MKRLSVNNLFWLILLLGTNLQAQVFIPFANWQRLSNCTATYCPTLSPIVATLQGTAGTTQVVNTCVDDGNTLVTFPFDFFLGNTAYRDWYFGSNAYVTAGAGSSVYTPLDATSPALPKFMVNANDGNYQKLYTIIGTNYVRVRFEGNSAYAKCNAIDTIFEITYYRTTVNYQYVQIVFGAQGVTNGAFGIADASTYYANTTPITANTSYVFYSYNGGKTWFILPNYSITGAGTTI